MGCLAPPRPAATSCSSSRRPIACTSPASGAPLDPHRPLNGRAACHLLRNATGLQGERQLHLHQRADRARSRHGKLTLSRTRWRTRCWSIRAAAPPVSGTSTDHGADRRVRAKVGGRGGERARDRPAAAQLQIVLVPERPGELERPRREYITDTTARTSRGSSADDGPRAAQPRRLGGMHLYMPWWLDNGSSTSRALPHRGLGCAQVPSYGFMGGFTATSGGRATAAAQGRDRRYYGVHHRLLRPRR